MRSLRAAVGLIVAILLSVAVTGQVAADNPVPATNPWVRVAVEPPFGAVCTAYWVESNEVPSEDYWILLIYEGPGGRVVGVVTRTQFGVYPAFRLDRVIVGEGTVTLFPTINFPGRQLVSLGSFRPVLFESAPGAELQVVLGLVDFFSGADIREVLRPLAVAWCEEAPLFQKLAVGGQPSS